MVKAASILMVVNGGRMQRTMNRSIVGAGGSAHGVRQRGATSRGRRATADALSDLAEQLQALRQRQGLMTRTNSRLRRGDAVDIEDLGHCGSVGSRGVGFDEAAIRKASAEIRRLEFKMREIQRREDRVPVIEHEGLFTYQEDPQGNRVAFVFEARPCAEIRGILSDHGFKSRGAAQLDWGRVMNTPGLAAARCVRELLKSTTK